MPYTPYTYTSPDDPAREDEGLFGPRSVTWRVMNSRIMWVAVVRALYLQALHPRVIRGPLSDMAATAGLRAAHLAFSQQWLFSGAMRAIHRAESAGENQAPSTAAR